MSFLLHPVHVFTAVLTEWVRHEQEKAIEFLRTETEVLLEQLGDKRILLSDDDRRLLAVKGMALEKEDLEKACVIVQPDTLRRWHRELVEQNRFKNPQRKTGRPSTDREIGDLVLRMARENPSWGYKRIEGALSNVGYSICSSTVANILKHHGVEPAPRRQRQLSWGAFLRAHMDAFEEADLLSVFGHLLAGIFAWPTIIRDHVRNALSESDLRMEESLREISDREWAVPSIPKAVIVEGHVVSREAASIESPQFTRGPPTHGDRCKSSPSNLYAKAA